MVSFVADKSHISKRLDVVLTKHDQISSRSEAQKIIKSGNVTVNNSSADISPSLIVKKGDIISFSLQIPSLSDIVPIHSQGFQGTEILSPGLPELPSVSKVSA